MNGGAPGACAACKYQRKRCAGNCELARYFPVSNTQDYLNCHRVFGTSTVAKIIKSVEEHERDTTAATLILEARMRVENPVHGSVATQRMLEAQIDAHLKELEDVKNQLAMFKNLHSQVQQVDNEQKDTSLDIVPQAE